MKQRLTNLLKYNRIVYLFYYSIMNLLINSLKPFIHTNNHLILFNSFAGRKYDDSPKEIYEAMKNDPRFKKYQLVWAFHEPSQYRIDGMQKIMTDSFQYFKMASA